MVPVSLENRLLFGLVLAENVVLKRKECIPIRYVCDEFLIQNYLMKKIKILELGVIMKLAFLFDLDYRKSKGRVKSCLIMLYEPEFSVDLLEFYSLQVLFL